MGYHVTILRTISGSRVPITAAEVERAAASMAGWEFDAEHQEASFFRNGREVVTVWLDDGELWTKTPANEAVSAMIQFAALLNARVRGDEFETYRTAHDAFVHPDDASEKAAADAEKRALIRKTKLKQWLFTACVFGSFFATGLIVHVCSTK